MSLDDSVRALLCTITAGYAGYVLGYNYASTKHREEPVPQLIQRLQHAKATACYSLGTIFALVQPTLHSFQSELSTTGAYIGSISGAVLGAITGTYLGRKKNEHIPFMTTKEEKELNQKWIELRDDILETDNSEPNESLLWDYLQISFAIALRNKQPNATRKYQDEQVALLERNILAYSVLQSVLKHPEPGAIVISRDDALDGRIYLQNEEKMRSIPLKLPSFRTIRRDAFPLICADVAPTIGAEENEPAFPNDLRLLAEKIAIRDEIAIVVSSAIPQERQRFFALQTYACAIVSRLMKNHDSKNN